MHARKAERAETSRKRDLHVPTYKGSLVVTVTTAVNTKVRMKRTMATVNPGPGAAGPSNEVVCVVKPQP